MTENNATIINAIQPPTLLIIPGLGGSGESHWQSHWHKEQENSVQLIQGNWDEPQLNDWLSKLIAAISLLNKPVLFVAHSLGVALVAHWANRYRNENIKGALLVAPADVDSPQHTPDVVRSFAPMPTLSLPFPSLVVASENDPYVSIERAAFFADKWGSRLVKIGAKGHINADSGLGDWGEGKILLQQLQERSGGG